MKKIDFDVIPLVISTILLLVSLYVFSTSNNVLSLEHYIGYTCFIVSVFLYFKNRLLYYVIFGLSLLAGLFGLIEFYFISYKVGFGSFGISPIFATLLILHLALAFEIAKKMDLNK